MSYQELRDELGVSLSDVSFEHALTHRSYAYEHPEAENYERLEFLGDTVLGRQITHWLFLEYPELDEGELAKRRASLVSAPALAEVARQFDLGKYLRLGVGEDQTGGRTKESILADVVEAILGATFLEIGNDAANALVMRMFEKTLASADWFAKHFDTKSALQELVSKMGHAAPFYRLHSKGPDHEKVFTAEVLVSDKVVGVGKGSSKKAAEIEAARVALEKLNA